MYRDELSPLANKLKRERKSESPIEEAVADCLRRIGAEFRQQEPIGQFFADFFLPEVNAVIECDGREFHDGTKDAERDAYMLGFGIRTFRLTGSEINHSPMRTVLRALGDITGNSEFSSIIPRLNYSNGHYCDGKDASCYECWRIKRMDRGLSMDPEIYFAQI